MFKFKSIAAATAAVIAVGSAANATTITVETFSDSVFTDFTTNNPIAAYQDFEGFALGEGNLLATNVGSFTDIDGNGSGSSVIGAGLELAVKDDTSKPFGRTNTTVGGANWLDSNDNAGILWTAGLLDGSLFKQVAFSLSDAADTGAELTVSAGGSDLTTFIDQDNGVVDWIVITFGGPVSAATIALTNNEVNDGFGIDDVVIAAVPLPAGAALMLTGLGGLAIARRRKAAK